MAIKHVIRDIKAFLGVGKLHRKIRTQDYRNILESEILRTGERGVSDEHMCESEVIISLTTYGNRINTVYLAIASLMRQSMRANRIILWLSEKEFRGGTLPATLRLLEKKGLEIKYCRDTRSYKKLIPTLSLYPDAIIITVDDDAIYDFELVDRLVRAHISEPTTVWGNRVHRMSIDKKGNIAPYKKWRSAVPMEESELNFATGVGGILYPPHIFLPEILDESKFMTLAPTADDIWFKAMELKSGVKVKRIPPHTADGTDDHLGGIVKFSDGLAGENVSHGRNDLTIKALKEYFDLLPR